MRFLLVLSLAACAECPPNEAPQLTVGTVCDVVARAYCERAGACGTLPAGTTFYRCHTEIAWDCCGETCAAPSPHTAAEIGACVADYQALPCDQLSWYPEPCRVLVAP